MCYPEPSTLGSHTFSRGDRGLGLLPFLTADLPGHAGHAVLLDSRCIQQVGQASPVDLQVLGEGAQGTVRRQKPRTQCWAPHPLARRAQLRGDR